jgi:hypothetical protein
MKIKFLDEILSIHYCHFYFNYYIFNAKLNSVILLVKEE